MKFLGWRVPQDQLKIESFDRETIQKGPDTPASFLNVKHASRIDKIISLEHPLAEKVAMIITEVALLVLGGVPDCTKYRNGTTEADETRRFWFDVSK